MSEQTPQPQEQSFNILDSVLENVQIGPQAGRDVNLTQIQGEIGAINVFGTVQVPQSSPNAANPLSREEYKWRKILLSKVQQFWINGVLAKSLHTRVLIELGLEDRSDQVQNPLEEGEEFASSRQAFTSGTSAADIFEDIGAGRTLLILGEPGAGKTVTLLKLAESLIKRAENDLSQPLPVVMNLSSWGKQRQPIAKWLEQELSDTYQGSRSIWKNWIAKEQLILLLDGLDEVATQHREACVKSLNQFIREHGSTEMVVCSRIRDYEVLSERLKLRSAICVQPLTSRQVTQFLEQAGEPLRALKEVIKYNTELREFASSPLILSIMSLTYQEVPVDRIIQGESIQDYRQHLFDTYVNRMFEGGRKSSYTRKVVESAQKYPRQKAQCWLIWIAQQMVQNSQTVFFIERLQPNWLQTKLQRILYSLKSIFVGGFISGIITGLIVGLLNGLANKSIYYIPYGFQAGGIIGVCSSPFFGFLGNIRTTENLKWDWKEAKKSFQTGMFFWSMVWLFVFIISSLSTYDTYDSESKIIWLGSTGLLLIVVVPVFTLVSGLVSGGIGGFRGPEISKKFSPNQGIWKSARNSTKVGIAGGLIGGLVSGLIAELIIKPIEELATGKSLVAYNSPFLEPGSSLLFGMIIGLISMLIGSLHYGGAACLRHFTLRLTLCHLGYIPWNYTRFLDYAAERLFLQKVGGGYIFVHRMLLEHFAGMELERIRN